MVRRASNLIDRMNYKTAESALRSALAEDDGALEKDIFRNLGLALFRQKKYQEAAEIYKKFERQILGGAFPVSCRAKRQYQCCNR